MLYCVNRFVYHHYILLKNYKLLWLSVLLRSQQLVIVFYGIYNDSKRSDSFTFQFRKFSWPEYSICRCIMGSVSNLWNNLIIWYVYCVFTKFMWNRIFWVYNGCKTIVESLQGTLLISSFLYCHFLRTQFMLYLVDFINVFIIIYHMIVILLISDQVPFMLNFVLFKSPSQ